MSSRPKAKSRTSRSSPPGGKRARTRETLLDIAAKLFETRGISAVSLDEIAANAGLTKGAIYGSFASKDDLVFAVAVERAGRMISTFDGATPVRQQLRALVKKWFGRAPTSRNHYAFMAELDLYAFSREKLAQRCIDYARERHLKSAEQLAQSPEKDELPLPPLEFSIVAHALFSSLLFQHACFPDIVTEDVAIRALEALID